MVQEHLFIKNSVAGDMTVFEVERYSVVIIPNDIRALYKHYEQAQQVPGGYYQHGSQKV